MKPLNNIRIAEGRAHVQDEVFFRCPETDFRTFGRKLYKHLGISYAKYYKMSPMCQLGFLASEILLMNYPVGEVDPELVSVVLANSSSSLHSDLLYKESIETKPSPALFVYTLPNIAIGEICIRNGFKGEGVFFIQESYDKEFIFDHTEALIDAGRSSLCIAGWLEMDIKGNYLANLSLLK